jgi:MFS family permease
MDFYQTLYFMSVVGGMAGLFTWTLASLACLALAGRGQQWISDLVAAAILGALVGGLAVGFDDHWSGSRVMPRRVIAAVALGIVTGLTASLLGIALSHNLAEHAPGMARVISWMLVGAFVGLAVGLCSRRLSVSTVTHGFTGGLFGGLLGGVLFTSLGSVIPNVSQALAFSFTSAGICAGIALAPALLRSGSLVFVSSGDARAQAKFGRSGKEWIMKPGFSYLIGSEPGQAGRRETEIVIPDAAIAPRHALLFERDGRFYLMRHPDAPPGGSILKIGPQTVVTKRELRHNDDILIGRTALEFVARSESESDSK